MVLWDFPSRSLRYTLRGHSGPIYCVAFSPGGDTLATASGDKSVKLWDRASGKELATLAEHSDVRAVASAARNDMLIIL